MDDNGLRKDAVTKKQTMKTEIKMEESFKSQKIWTLELTMNK